MSDLTDQAWSEVFSFSETILDDRGMPLGKRGRALAGMCQQAGMSYTATEAVLVNAKYIKGSPWPYVKRCVEQWRMEREQQRV